MRGLWDLASWPSTPLVVRDGRARRVHSGFASPASGALPTAARAEFAATIAPPLAEDAPAPRRGRDTRDRAPNRGMLPFLIIRAPTADPGCGGF